MKHFVHIRTLIIASKKATSGATQVQPQVHHLVQPHIHLLCIFMETAKCTLRCTIKCTLRCTPSLHCRVDYQLGVKCMIFFTIFCILKCSLKWNLRFSQEQHRVPPQVHLFIESFCALLCPDMCTTMRIFKCNSIVTSSAPLISTSNAPSCASVYRSQGTALGVSSDEPSVASSIALTNAPSSTPSSATSNASFLSLSYESSMVL